MKYIYFVDTKLICYYLFQRGSSISGMYDKIASLLYNFPKGEIYLGWDIGKSEYRLSISPTYKGHRAVQKGKLSEADQEAHAKFNEEYLKMAELADLLSVKNLKVQGVECDDMCSILAKTYENVPGYTVYLLTADMDWIHSVVDTNNVSIIDVYNGGAIIDHKVVEEEYGIDTRRKFTVLKSILGDKSDNIKFCSFLGPVKARELFNSIYKQYTKPTDEQIVACIEEYLNKKEEDRVARKRRLSILVHPDHTNAGRLTPREAFLANMSIADPFQTTDYLSDRQLEDFYKCLDRVPPESTKYEDLLMISMDVLGYALQFGHKASRVFKVV